MRLWITILLVTSFLSAGDKIALLIGNNDYTFQPLDNPLHDVDGIYKTLKEIGFDISKKDVLKNASKTTMENALANFAQRATTAEIALIYFSGHGMQVNNINYMFPARTTATKPIHLRGLVDLNYFIESATSAKYGIVLVDACRNNPLVKYFQNGKHKGATAKKGLGQVTPTTGQVVIGFATSAGDTADDGNGDMSPYAKALSVRLKESDDIRNILGKVGNDVSKKYEQNPIYRANLASSVCLNGGCSNNTNIPLLPQKISSTLKWIMPNKTVCEAHGGKFNNKGVCISTYNNAEKICINSGAILPLRKYFKKVVLDCGGDWNDWEKNNISGAYKSCYQQKGFSDDDGYWNSDDSDTQWYVYFFDGDDMWGDSSGGGRYYVSCIR